MQCCARCIMLLHAAVPYAAGALNVGSTHEVNGGKITKPSVCGTGASSALVSYQDADNRIMVTPLTLSEDRTSLSVGTELAVTSYTDAAARADNSIASFTETYAITVWKVQSSGDVKGCVLTSATSASDEVALRPADSGAS